MARNTYAQPSGNMRSLREIRDDFLDMALDCADAIDQNNYDMYRFICCAYV